MSEFRLHAPYQPTGDQPEAIRELVEGRKSVSDIAGSNRFRENLYHGECDTAITEADTYHSA